jgi:hypothetical protein
VFFSVLTEPSRKVLTVPSGSRPRKLIIPEFTPRSSAFNTRVLGGIRPRKLIIGDGSMEVKAKNRLWPAVSDAVNE